MWLADSQPLSDTAARAKLIDAYERKQARVKSRRGRRPADRDHIQTVQQIGSGGDAREQAYAPILAPSRAYRNGLWKASPERVV